MNTVFDLRRELADLAGRAPAYDEIRSELAGRALARERRRRTTALIAVAAAVVLVVGGIGVTRAMVSGDPGVVRPAAPSGVVAVPEVPLPADTQLIRHQLQPVVSPVSATAPAGLAGLTWMQSPGRLAVSYFDQSAGGDGMIVRTGDSPEPKTAGYVVTDSATDHLRTFGANGATSVAATSRDITVAGHAAWLDTAPDGAVDAMGLPAAQRVSWKLSNGKYIHVWATGPQTPGTSLSAVLLDFAKTITDIPRTLPRALGIGLTLPGLTVDSSMNVPVVGGFTPEYLMMCPAGVDPVTVTGSSSSGSGTADSGGTVAGESMSIEPGATGESVATSDGPSGRCLTVAVFPTDAATNLGESGSREMSVAGTTATVVSVAGVAAATVDLGSGLTAVVGAPASARLSDADLAALAASVRLSPEVRVIPASSSSGQESGATVTDSGSSSAVASSSTAASVSAAPRIPFIPSTIDRGVGWNVQADESKVTLGFSIQNITDEPVRITSLQLDAQRLRLTSAQVSLDAPDPTMSGLSLPFHPVPLPATVPPRSNAQLRFTFDLTACTPVTDTHPPLVVGWQTADGAGDVNVQLMYADDPGWVVEMTKNLCP